MVKGLGNKKAHRNPAEYQTPQLPAERPQVNGPKSPIPAVDPRIADAFEGVKVSGQAVQGPAAEAPSQGMSALGFLASNNAADRRQQVKHEINQAMATLLDADTDDNGRVDITWNRDEMKGVQDPLARALYEFTNYANYDGQMSYYGPETRGDVQEGGLGLGYTTRPKHYTSFERVRVEELAVGAKELGRRLDPERKLDMADRDLEKVLGGVGGDRAAGCQEVHEAAERLLDHIMTETEKLEVRTGDSGALLSHQQLLDSLEPGSLEHRIASQLLEGQVEGSDGAERWMDFFKRGIDFTRIDERGTQTGKVGTMLQQYLHSISKRAQEGVFIAQASAALDAKLALGDD